MRPCAHAIGAAWIFHGATAATASAGVAAALDVAAEADWLDGPRNEPKPSSPRTAANTAARHVRDGELGRRRQPIMLVGIDRVACHLNHSNEEQPPAQTFPRINKSLHKRCFYGHWAAPAGFRLLSR